MEGLLPGVGYGDDAGAPHSPARSDWELVAYDPGSPLLQTSFGGTEEEGEDITLEEEEEEEAAGSLEQIAACDHGVWAGLHAGNPALPILAHLSADARSVVEDASGSSSPDSASQRPGFLDEEEDILYGFEFRSGAPFAAFARGLSESEGRKGGDLVCYCGPRKGCNACCAADPEVKPSRAEGVRDGSGVFKGRYISDGSLSFHEDHKTSGERMDIAGKAQEEEEEKVEEEEGEFCTAADSDNMAIAQHALSHGIEDQAGQRQGRSISFSAAWVWSRIQQCWAYLHHAKAVWPAAVAAAVLGLLLCGRAWRRTQLHTRYLQRQLRAKDKKLSQLLFQLIQIKMVLAKTRDISMSGVKPPNFFHMR